MNVGVVLDGDGDGDEPNHRDPSLRNATNANDIERGRTPRGPVSVAVAVADNAHAHAHVGKRPSSGAVTDV